MDQNQKIADECSYFKNELHKAITSDGYSAWQTIRYIQKLLGLIEELHYAIKQLQRDLKEGR